MIFYALFGGGKFFFSADHFHPQNGLWGPLDPPQSQIETFLSHTIYKGILYEKQFGFRKNHSTNHALVSIVEEMRKNLDRGIYSCGVLSTLKSVRHC